MNINLTLDQFDESCVFYCDPIKNNVMNNGIFTRILYSTPTFVMNGIHLLIPIHEINMEKYYQKIKCSFHTSTYKDVIDHIQSIEQIILRQINRKDKIVQYKIFDQLRNGNIKLFPGFYNGYNSGYGHGSSACTGTSSSYSSSFSGNSLFMLKISGVWETEYYYGLTYKFIKLRRPTPWPFHLPVSMEIFQNHTNTDSDQDIDCIQQIQKHSHQF